MGLNVEVKITGDFPRDVSKTDVDKVLNIIENSKNENIHNIIKTEIFIPISNFTDIVNPTNEEVLSFIGDNSNVEVYMNGSEVDDDNESLYVWYVDLQGNLITLKNPKTEIGIMNIGLDIFDTKGNIIPEAEYTYVNDGKGGGYIYKDNMVYVLHKDGNLTPLVGDGIFPSVDYDFVTLFTCNNDVKLTCDSIELNIRNEDTKVITPYVSADTIVAGTYIVYGKEVDNVRFINNSFDSVNIIRNSFQTDATYMFYNLTKLNIFEAGATTFGNITNFYYAWRDCSSLTSFPLIDTSKGIDFTYTWGRCTSLTDFPLLDTSNVEFFNNTWYECTSLTSFPLIDTIKGTNFKYTWYGCRNLTEFPLLDTGNGTDFSYAWYACTSLTSFPLLDTGNAIDLNSAWRDCRELTSFPLLDTSKGTDFGSAWRDCTSLTSFPLLDTGNGIDFTGTWMYCSSLTSFPLIDTSKGTIFTFTWYECTSLTSFPLIDFTTATIISYTFNGCTSLTCMDGIINDDDNNPDNASTFDGCTALLRPNTTEQTDIENGINWVNDTEC